MKLLFASVGAYGHMIPLLPLALAAREAGHSVDFATHERFHAMPLEAGLQTVAAGGTVAEAMGTAIRQTPEGQPVNAAPQAFGSLLPRRAIADLVPVLADGKYDLVVYEMLNPGAGIAAKLTGVPAVAHAVGRLNGGPNWVAMRDTWVATAVESGVRTPGQDAQFFGNRYLDICPPSLRLPELFDPTDGIALRPVSYSRPTPLPSFLGERDTSRPLVFLTFGTAFGEAEVLQQVIDGLSTLPVDVIVSAGRIEKTAVAASSAHVAIEQWVPQGDLLKHADLVVSHGGSGTTLGALAEGLPHLVLPQGADQFSNAHMVSHSGLGRQLLPREITADAIGEHTMSLLHDRTVKARTAELADEIAQMPTPQETIGAVTGNWS